MTSRFTEVILLQATNCINTKRGPNPKARVTITATRKARQIQFGIDLLICLL